jgi:hypothetical protein
LPGPDLLAAVSGLRPGDSVGFITEDPAPPWAVTLQRGFRYASRYYGFWMLRAVIRDEGGPNPDPRLKQLGRTIVANTVVDFRCIRPGRIIVARPQSGAWNEHTIDILPFFLRDPDFAEFLSHYHPVGPRTTFEVYRLDSPPAGLPASACRPGF